RADERCGRIERRIRLVESRATWNRSHVMRYAGHDGLTRASSAIALFALLVGCSGNANEPAGPTGDPSPGSNGGSAQGGAGSGLGGSGTGTSSGGSNASGGTASGGVTGSGGTST